jgi:hypothetical protein
MTHGDSSGDDDSDAFDAFAASASWSLERQSLFLRWHMHSTVAYIPKLRRRHHELRRRR